VSSRPGRAWAGVRGLVEGPSPEASPAACELAGGPCSRLGRGLPRGLVPPTGGSAAGVGWRAVAGPWGVLGHRPTEARGRRSAQARG